MLPVVAALEKPKDDTTPAPLPDSSGGRPHSAPTPYDPRREVLPDWHYAYSRLVDDVRQMPLHVDDVDRDFPEAYERMMLDPQVGSTIDTETYATIPPRIETVPDGYPDEATYERADLYARFCDANLRRMSVGFETTLAEMLETAQVYGHCFAHIVLEQGEMPEFKAGPLWLLKAIKPKHRRTYRILQDPYNNFLGLDPVTPGQYYSGSLQWSEVKRRRIPPRGLFCIVNRGQFGDMRGRSDLRRMYYSWWFKKQLEPAALKAYAQFGTPSMKYKMGAGTPPNYPDPENPGQEIASYALAARGMEKFQNAMYIVLPPGDDAEPIVVGNVGEAFATMFGHTNNEITKSETGQVMASDPTDHHSRAGAQVQQNIMGLRPRGKKSNVAQRIGQDIYRYLLELNFGPASVAQTPRAELGQTQEWDFGTVGNTLAQMSSNHMFSPSQSGPIISRAGLPRRSNHEADLEAQVWDAEMRAREATARFIIENPGGAPKPAPQGATAQ